MTRRSFFRTAVAVAALCVMPSFVQRETRRLLRVEEVAFSVSRMVYPTDTLTVRVLDCERAFNCDKHATVYGVVVAAYDDGSHEILAPIDDHRLPPAQGSFQTKVAKIAMHLG